MSEKLTCVNASFLARRRPLFFRVIWTVLFGLLVGPASPAATLEADVCVYGGTSGGVTAAVQAARMGKRVVLVSDYGHLGGLSSSGLGETDIGKSSILGGLSKEFYQRIKIHYSGGSLPSVGTQLTFEPHVAEGVFDLMVAEQADLLTVTNGLINLTSGVTMNGQRITAIHLEDGTTIEADMFIDACYEGDLMALAGVSFTIGRESNAQYGETGNGNRGASGLNQIANGVDPYVVEGDPMSGLLPGINPDTGGDVGDADHRLQAYNYRMCLTDAPANRLTVTQPAGYDEADYELLFRAIEAGDTNGFWKTSAMPNNKTDSNNNDGVSTDFIGRNYSELPPTHPDYWDWSTLNHAERAALAAEHRDWQLGLMWSVQNHPRVPEHVRNHWGVWGLPLDEFTDNGHWPYNLYVREARRMISDYVMIEQNALGTRTVSDSIGMGAYTLDSHHTQRVVSNGQVKNEGDIQKTVREPYPIAYRSIVPAVGECENLLVPWCTSSSHIAFGSIRMEPVFMHTGQAAATAACLAIEDGVNVQQVDYAKLSVQMEADGQIRYLTPDIVGSPEVWLFAKDEELTEGEQALDSGFLTIGRTGSTASALDITLTVGGSATPGADYPAFSNPVQIPAGKAAISIEVTAFWDDVVDDAETIEVGLVVPGGYAAGATTSAVFTVTDSPVITYASVAFSSWVKISGNSDFDVSVYPGKAGYDGLVSGAFGDGTVEAYQFFRNDPTTGGVLLEYAEGGSLLSDPTYTSVAASEDFEHAYVWTGSDPDSAAADFGSTTANISGGYEVSGEIDISPYSTGTVYALVGGYFDPFQVTLTMYGEEEWYFGEASPEINPGNDRNMYVVAFTFDNPWAKYDLLKYDYTGSRSNRSRFMGIVVDGATHLETDYDNWAAGYLPEVLGAPGDDFDSNGMSNDASRIWGLDPTDPEARRPFASPMDASSGILCYTRRDPALTGATFQYQYATTLDPSDWTGFTPEDEAISEDGPLQSVCITLGPALRALPRVYVRAIATTP